MLTSGGLFARKNWKRRFFVLQDTIIKYYKVETETGLEEALGTQHSHLFSQITLFFCNIFTDRILPTCSLGCCRITALLPCLPPFLVELMAGYINLTNESTIEASSGGTHSYSELAL